MFDKEFLQAITEYDETKHFPDYAIWKEERDLVKKASLKLGRFSRYLQFRKILEEMGERDLDVHIVSHAKSGTTLTQMMLYQMTTDGSMDFEHIYDVSPWPSWQLAFGKKFDYSAQRRLIKYHDSYSFLSHVKKGKFLFLIRELKDVLASFYQHLKDYYQEEKSFEEWAPPMIEHWYKYNKACLKNESNLEILYVNYEDTIADKSKQIDRIADFLGIELSSSHKERVIERTAFDFMKKHETKFGDQPDNKKIYNNFIRKGKVGEGKQLLNEELLLKSNELAKDFFLSNEITARYYE